MGSARAVRAKLREYNELVGGNVLAMDRELFFHLLAPEDGGLASASIEFAGGLFDRFVAEQLSRLEQTEKEEEEHASLAEATTRPHLGKSRIGRCGGGGGGGGQ